MRDRATGVRHRAQRRSARLLRFGTAELTGKTRKLRHAVWPGTPPELDDVELAHKVESIVFRDRTFPKGRITLNAENGCIVLRGEVDRPDLVSDLESAVREVRGVRDVENLLHLTGTPAPKRRSMAAPRVR